MDAFPAYFPLTGRTVVIVGDGEGAQAKVRLFEGSPAEIRGNAKVQEPYLGGHKETEIPE